MKPALVEQFLRASLAPASHRGEQEQQV